MSLDLRQTRISQAGLRDLGQVWEMVKFVQSGGRFDAATLSGWAESHGGRCNPPLIAATRFPDGLEMLHDGHHRAVACVLGGRTSLYDDEFFIKEFTYEEYLEVNFDEGWLTPFDPREEVRLGDFGKFKDEARRLFASDRESGMRYIVANGDAYKTKGGALTVAQFAENYRHLTKRSNHAVSNMFSGIRPPGMARKSP